MTAPTLPDVAAAEARGLAKAARTHEEAGRRDEARRLYLEAAARFLNSSKDAPDPSTSGLRRDLAEGFYAKALHMTPPPKAARLTEAAADEKQARFAPAETPNVTFRDVAGMEDVKKAIRKAIILPLKRPDLFAHYGRSAGDGILLYGPPGCGKTHIARAAAGECGIPFYNVKISDVLSKWVGDNERNLRELFATARKAAPAIVFLDEVDALARKRSGSESAYVNRLVNEFLTQLDGAEGKDPNKPLLVMAATNQPWALDAAFRRPGRFTRLLFVPPPDFDARAELLRLCTKARPVANDVDFESLASKTDTWSSADIKQLCEDAADIPLLEALEGADPRPINGSDFQAALTRRRPSVDGWFSDARRHAHADPGLAQEIVRSVGDPEPTQLDTPAEPAQGATFNSRQS